VRSTLTQTSSRAHVLIGAWRASTTHLSSRVVPREPDGGTARPADQWRVACSPAHGHSVRRTRRRAHLLSTSLITSIRRPMPNAISRAWCRRHVRISPHRPTSVGASRSPLGHRPLARAPVYLLTGSAPSRPLPASVHASYAYYGGESSSLVESAKLASGQPDACLHLAGAG
jgi:hypothetical protein